MRPEPDDFSSARLRLRKPRARIGRRRQDGRIAPSRHGWRTGRCIRSGERRLAARSRCPRPGPRGGRRREPVPDRNLRPPRAVRSVRSALPRAVLDDRAKPFSLGMRSASASARPAARLGRRSEEDRGPKVRDRPPRRGGRPVPRQTRRMRQRACLPEEVAVAAGIMGSGPLFKTASSEGSVPLAAGLRGRPRRRAVPGRAVRLADPPGRYWSEREDSNLRPPAPELWAGVIALPNAI